MRQAFLVLIVTFAASSVKGFSEDFFRRINDVPVPHLSFLDHDHDHDHSVPLSADQDVLPTHQPLRPIDESLERDLHKTTDLSLISYCEDLRGWQCRLCAKYSDMELVAQVDDSVGKGYVALSPLDRRVYVLFRALKTMRNALSSLRVRRVPVVDHGRVIGHVHRGIYAHWKDVREEYVDAVVEAMRRVGEQRWRREHWQIMVSGVSYGAALSIIAGWELRQRLSDGRSKLFKGPFHARVPIRVLAHGSPRVGDAEFAQSLEQATSITYQQTMIEDDLVTKLPGDGYDTVGQKIWRDRQGQWWVCPDKHDPRCDTTMRGSLSPHFDYWKKYNYDICQRNDAPTSTDA